MFLPVNLFIYLSIYLFICVKLHFTCTFIKTYFLCCLNVTNKIYIFFVSIYVSSSDSLGVKVDFLFYFIFIEEVAKLNKIFLNLDLEYSALLIAILS